MYQFTLHSEIYERNMYQQFMQNYFSKTPGGTQSQVLTLKVTALSNIYSINYELKEDWAIISKYELQI